MGRPPHPILVLLGPRGVGKTILLEHAMEEAGKRDIHAAEISCELLSGPQSNLVKEVFPRRTLKKVLDHIDGIQVKLPRALVSIDPKEAEKNFSAALPAFLSEKPLLLVLDEAHHCDTDPLNMLFGIVQSCMRRRMPLALILAGTPGLGPHMRKCKATYVERAKFMRINTLSQEEAKEALEKPAKESGRPMKPDALKLLLEWSDSYPFFIQMAGTYAWDISEERNGKSITAADAKAGLDEADGDREYFYSERHTELMDLLLADRSIEVINIIRELGGKAKIAALAKRLMEMDDGMDGRNAMEVIKKLQEVGFLWRSREGIEPGIPSLFDYLLSEHVT